MNDLWEKVKEKIRREIPENSYNLWIHPIVLEEGEDHTFVLGCPNKFSLNWVMENYRNRLEKAFGGMVSGPYRLDFRVKRQEKKPKEREILEEPRQLTLPNVPGNGRMRRSWLNRDLTFDRFVVGKCNEFAYSVSKAMAHEAIGPYTPLFMLSNTGLGKSHLTHAIGHAIMDHDAESRVYYKTAEDFVNEMVFALKTRQIDAFKKKYRSQCDVLLLEDVHFLSGKQKTQLELEYTLDVLFNDHKKIIFTSSMLPKNIPNMTKEIASRLTSGIITTLDRPDYATRLRIIERKSAEQSLSFSDDVTHILAKHLTRDIRQIESALACLKAKSELLKAKITRDLAMDVVHCHVSEDNIVTIDEIKTLLCRYFKIEPATLGSKSRKKIHTYPRNLYAYLCRHYTDATLEEIGKSIKRNHSTALYASEVITKKMKMDKNVSKQVEFFRRKLEERMR